MGLLSVLKRNNGYIPARATIAAARKARLSICDHLEREWGTQGATQRIVDRMPLRDGMRVVEIGPGTGRYIEKLRERIQPASYEVYETARDWADWLERTYPVIVHDADGQSLRQTPDASADLIHAHGVFTYIPFVTSFGYWREMWRVAAPGAVVVFDCFTEATMPPHVAVRWLESPHAFPVMVPLDYVTGLFRQQGFDLVDSFASPCGPGECRYLVFTSPPP